MSGDLIAGAEKRRDASRKFMVLVAQEPPCRIAALAAIVRRELNDNPDNVLDVAHDCLTLLERLAKGESIPAADIDAWVESGRAQQAECAGEGAES